MNEKTDLLVKKRDGSLQKFDKKRIERAIYNALLNSNKPDKKLAKEITEKVVDVIIEIKENPIDLEKIQDIIEMTLMKKDLVEVAKNYIIYRKKREEIRKEKMSILMKDKLDEIDKKFDINALKVLTSRYLKKDENGKIIESPKDLFIRVALNVIIGDILHDPDIFDKECKQEIKEEENINYEEYEKAGCIKIGDYKFNRYHLETLKRTYDSLNKEKKMKKKLGEILTLIAEGKMDKYKELLEEYIKLMTEKRFMPNTPALVNFGNVLGMGSACFVLGIEDDLGSIMDNLKYAALIFQSGGGCGYNFSKLRPKGDVVNSTKGVASGPISFMQMYDAMTDVIKQGGIRRGANMGILNIDHPDIEAFITAKEKNKQLKNFNISVLLKEGFLEAVEKKEKWKLINPRTKEIVKELDASYLFDMIAYQARNYAEPGVIFMDNINKHNPLLKELGPIITTNPCGEVILYPNESCNLGSINVDAFLKEGTIDWEELEKTVKLATRFLDNVIDVNKYPLEQIKEMTRKTRKIGLGVMGVGDLLYDLEIKYDSEEGIKFMEKLMEFINYYSKIESIKLAEERGSFPLFEKSFYPEGKLPISGPEEGGTLNWELIREKAKKGIRNAFTTVIAPTGSISMIAGTSSGIEPVFSLVYEKRVVVGRFFYVDPAFERVLKKYKIYSEELLEKISNNGGRLGNIEGIPEKLKEFLVTAMDISPEMHVRAQAAFQKWVDSSISKTINMPRDATVEDVKKAYILAHKLGCKGVTVYRDGSIEEQVLVAGKSKKEEIPKPIIEERAKESKGVVGEDICPVCGEYLVKKEGCATCPNCGWSKCSVA